MTERRPDWRARCRRFEAWYFDKPIRPAITPAIIGVAVVVVFFALALLFAH